MCALIEAKKERLIAADASTERSTRILLRRADGTRAQRLLPEDATFQVAGGRCVLILV